MKRIMAAAVIAALAACETPKVTQEEMASVNYGPKPEHWREEIRDYLSLRLRDPKSAIVEYRSEPRQMFQRQVALDPQQHGWAVCVWVNDRNTEGAYEGFRPMTFFIHNEKVVYANNDPDHRGPVFAEYAKRQCAELGAPFKE